MDGSLGGLYTAPAPAHSAQSDHYVLYLQGGAWCFDEATCPYFDNDKAPASPFCAFPAQSVAIPSASKCNLGVASLYLPGTPVEEGTWADRPHGCGFIAEATHYLGPFINMGITEIVDTCQWANDGTCDVPSQWNAP